MTDRIKLVFREEGDTSPITIDQVQSVYSGKLGACCCGCAGKHTYRQDLADYGKELRGYDFSEDDLNDRVLKRHLNTINKALADGSDFVKVDDFGAVYETATRWYIAYFFRQSDAVKLIGASLNLPE
jgi:hypothetical protein